MRPDYVPSVARVRPASQPGLARSDAQCFRPSKDLLKPIDSACVAAVSNSESTTGLTGREGRKERERERERRRSETAFVIADVVDDILGSL